jgi:cytochrome b subunit of formate dehydrogenase
MVTSASPVRPVLRRSYAVYAIIIGFLIAILGIIIWRSLLTPVVARPYISISLHTMRGVASSS